MFSLIFVNVCSLQPPLQTTYNKNSRVSRPVYYTTDVKLVGGQERGKQL
jgi:hypothetical protein